MLQGFVGVLLQPVQVFDRRRVRRAAGLEVMRIVAFHLFSSATPGVGAGTRIPWAILHRALAVRIVDEVLGSGPPSAGATLVMASAQTVVVELVGA